MRVDLPESWRAVLGQELASSWFSELGRFVDDERDKAKVYPPEDDVFRAFRAAPFSEVRVVLLGQDPYHGAGQAHGLCFSVPEGVALPPSLRNILRELKDDLGIEHRGSGDLSRWSERGMLMLNTVLTVREGEAGSHQKRGWETFTDAAVRALGQRDKPPVFALWGKPAEQKRKLLGTSARVVSAAHPSPLSAYRGFLGAKPFTAIQSALTSQGGLPFDFS
jgi:uracil-DNA glycosylase